MNSAFQLAITLAKGIPEAAVVLDASLSAHYYNSVFLQLTGLKKRAIEARISKGESLLSMLNAQGDLDLDVIRSCMQEKETITLTESQLHNAQGEAITVSITYVPLIELESGDVEGVLQIIRDHTAEVVVHERFKKLLAAERVRAEELERRVEERTKELEEALGHLTRLSRIDPLTGLLNRRYFAEQADQALAMAQRHNRSMALLIYDLDHFKRINDTYGHQAGDALLCRVAECLLKAVRNTDSVGRLGGEEFLILLSELEPGSATHIAERSIDLIRKLDLPQIIPGAIGRQTMSVGLALYPDHGDTLEKLIRCADQALYHAKGTGRDRLVLFDPSLERSPNNNNPRLAPKVLLVDTSGQRLETYQRQLVDRYRVASSTSLSLAAVLWRREHFDVLVMDETLGSQSGEELKKITKEAPMTLGVLVSTEEPSPEVDGIHFTLSRRDAQLQLANVVQNGLAWREADSKSFDLANWRSFAIRKLEKEHMDQLLAERRLSFVYQPIIQHGQTEPFGFEALVRTTDQGIEQDPLTLVDAARRTGNIWNFGRLVREIASAPLALLPANTILFINMHPEEIEDPFLDDVTLIPSRFASRIVFEISEGSAIEDFPHLHRRMVHLREHGYRFAIDDLGSAYSGLKSITLLDPEFVKFDMELIRGIESSTRKRSLVRKIVDFCKEEEMIVIAEGVETEKEVEVLRRLGCNFFQGFHFGVPGDLDLLGEEDS